MPLCIGQSKLVKLISRNRRLSYEVKSDRGQISYDVTYVWNLQKKKKMQMNLFPKQRFIDRTQSHGYQRGWQAGDEVIC